MLPAPSQEDDIFLGVVAAGNGLHLVAEAEKVGTLAVEVILAAEGAPDHGAKA